MFASGWAWFNASDAVLPMTGSFSAVRAAFNSGRVIGEPIIDFDDRSAGVRTPMPDAELKQVVTDSREAPVP